MVGCGQYDMDEALEGGAYIKHVTAGRVVIGCNETGDSFELTCENGSWIGERTNCSSLFTSKYWYELIKLKYDDNNKSSIYY